MRSSCEELPYVFFMRVESGVMMLIVPGSRIRGVGVLLVAYEVKHC